MPIKNQLSLLISATFGLNTLLAIPVFAQDSAIESEEDLILEEVIVTGTRIKNEDGYGRTSPVIVLGEDEIGSFGYTRVEEFLNSLPQIEVSQNAFSNDSFSGTATLDLRGLGASRTLVLINGRRMQPGGVFIYAPDVNQIPAQMIERVEVLTGGASATYGADAVAGVVNFIMRRVDGVEVSVSMNGYQHDNRNNYIQGLMDEWGYAYPTGNTGLDGRAYSANIVIGGDFASGRGNATVYANWRKNDALLRGSRDYSSCALNAAGTTCAASIAAPEVPNFFIAPLTEDGYGPYGYDYSEETFFELQPDSSLMVVEAWWNSTNRYNFAPVNYYMLPEEHWSLGAFIDYEINEHAVAYLETMSANDATNSQLAESGVFLGEEGSFQTLPLSNAYFPENFKQSLQQRWPGEEEFGLYIGKRNLEGGPRRYMMNHTSFRIVTGLRGSITGDWDYDVSYLYAHTSSSTAYVNDFLAPMFATAIDSRLCEPDPACIPYEVFTYRGVTKAAADSISGTATADSGTGTTVIQAYVTGTTPWGLPAGKIMTAAGYEYRRVQYGIDVDSIFAQNQLSGQEMTVKDLEGSYSVNELFVEANVPLLADASIARNMTLDLAYRWSDYSTSGPNSTYRLGLDWQVLDWLRLRSGYNRAVRTPNIAELYTPRQSGYFFGVDPCEGDAPAYSLEQCARSGVTAQQYGNILPSFYQDQASGLSLYNAQYGGNPELDPEEADTITAGLVLDFGESMQLSVDYWDIKIKDSITWSLNPAVALEQCLQYDRLCDLVHRTPDSGSLWRGKDAYVYATSWNLGEEHSRGIDLAWNWSPGNHWKINLIGSYYLEREATLIPDDPGTTFDCAGLAKNDPGGESCWPTPRWQQITSATYDSEGFWALTGRWRFYSKVTYEGTRDLIADKSLGAQSYFDLIGIFRFMDTHELTLGINNILDEEPPLVGASLSHNANSVSIYDQLGRFLFANLVLRW